MIQRKLGWVLVLVLGCAPARAGFEIRYTPDGPVAEQKSEENPSPAPAAASVSAAAPVEGLVAVPLADLRDAPLSAPREKSRPPWPKDPRQLTQLLFGERVRIVSFQDGWFRVTAPEQSALSANGHWGEYAGWVPQEAVIAYPSDFYPSAVVIKTWARFREKRSSKSAFMDLPMGARVGVVYKEKRWVRVQGPRGAVGWMTDDEVRLDRDAPLHPDQIRRAVIAAVHQFLGTAYYWGGRAAYRRDAGPSGVDCSGLVNAVYRSGGANVPRDAHEQFLTSQPLEKGSDLLPGDLVFVSKKSAPNRAVHVLLFEKNETMIEADSSSGRVRRVTFKKRWGRPRTAWTSGDEAGEEKIWFRRYINR